MNLQRSKIMYASGFSAQPCSVHNLFGRFFKGYQGLCGFTVTVACHACSVISVTVKVEVFKDVQLQLTEFSV